MSSDSKTMTSSRPYLIRALGEWIVDNNLTPYIMVDALVEGAQVPTQFVKDGKIVLNIGPYAVQDLDVSNECVHFFARFNGISTEVLVPIRAVLAIYAKENGQGMVFVDPDSPAPDPQSPDSSSNQGKSGSKPNLKLVK